MYWFLSWPLVLDWIRTLEIGFGLVSRAPDCYWIGFGGVQLGFVLDSFWIVFEQLTLNILNRQTTQPENP